MNMLPKYLLPLFILTAGMPVSPAYAASKTEARPTTDDVTPQAQYQRSRREAQAAYREAQAACRKMPASERGNCTKEAKANLQSDLTEAKKALSSGQ